VPTFFADLCLARADRAICERLVPMRRVGWSRPSPPSAEFAVLIAESVPEGRSFSLLLMMIDALDGTCFDFFDDA
jgi:hypothetical protein